MRGMKVEDGMVSFTELPERGSGLA